MLEYVLQHGSLAVIFFALLAGGLGLPLPEDLVLLAGGALWHRGILSWQVLLPTCYLGVLCGDFIIFSLARHWGRRALEHRLFKRLLTPDRLAKVEDLFQRRGGAVIFFARYTGPLRAPVYAIAGMRNMAPGRFLAWDALALLLSVPVVTGLGYTFSEHLDLAINDMAEARHYLVLGACALGVVIWGWRVWSRREH